MSMTDAPDIARKYLGAAYLAAGVACLISLPALGFLIYWGSGAFLRLTQWQPTIEIFASSMGGPTWSAWAERIETAGAWPAWQAGIRGLLMGSALGAISAAAEPIYRMRRWWIVVPTAVAGFAGGASLGALIGFGGEAGLDVVHRAMAASPWTMAQHWGVQVAAAAAALVGFTTFWFMAAGTEARDGFRHVSGLRLVDGRRAAEKAAAALVPEVKRLGRGIELAPGVPVGLEREAQAGYIVGAPGSGKTVMLKHVIAEALQNKSARFLVHDVKGDFTEAWPEEEFILIAPWDSRSYVFDIAAEIHDEITAREIAGFFFKAGKGDTNQFWNESAKNLLAGMFVTLHAEKPGDWTWEDLADFIAFDAERMKDRMSSYAPWAAKVLTLDKNGAPSNQAAGVLGTVEAYSNALIRPLSIAWKSLPSERRICISDWILRKGPSGKIRTIILQNNARFADLSARLIAAVFDLAANAFVSPEVITSKENRLWFFIDEFAQLAAIDRIRAVIEVGRSKGGCVWIATQSNYQIIEKYKEDWLNILLTMVKTQVYLLLGAGPENELARKIMGKRIVLRPITIERQGKVYPDTKREEMDVVTTDYILGLGPRHDGKGVDGLALGLSSSEIFRVSWPFAGPHASTWKPRRAPIKMSKWITNFSASTLSAPSPMEAAAAAGQAPAPGPAGAGRDPVEDDAAGVDLSDMPPALIDLGKTNEAK